MKKRLQKENGVPASGNLPENGMYYEKLADNYHIAKFIFLILLFVFFAAIAVLGRDEIRLRNFRYLMKNAADDPVRLAKSAADFDYTAGDGVRFFLYKNDVAVVGDGGLSLYTLDGARIYHDTTESGMTADASGRYLALYRTGARMVSYYDSFSWLATKTYDFPVGFAAVSSSGTSAVYVKENTAAVYLYDSSFQLIEVWRADKSSSIVFDLSFSTDGKKLAVLTLTTSGGGYRTELSIITASDGKSVSETVWEAQKPAAVEFFEDGRFFVMTDASATFYRANGETAERVMWSGSLPKYKMQGDRVLFYDSSVLRVYDSRAQMLIDVAFPEAVYTVCADNDNIYVLTAHMVYIYKIGEEERKEYPVESGALDMLVPGHDCVLLCYTSGIRRLNFE